MIILGIETSCDETAAAIVENKRGVFKVRSNVVSSQIKIHAKTGGVVPEVAAREHIKNILPVVEQALKEGKATQKDIDAIAVTTGPGLITSLIVGVETAKTLAHVWNKPVVSVNHIEAHLYANFASNKKVSFPLLALIVSGGHTELILMKKHGHYKLIGKTRDDAAGEAFDKVAKILKLGYPGGPIISKLANKGNARAFDLPRPMLKDKTYDFSFSGLKTAVLYESQSKKHNFNSKKKIADMSASFEQATVDVLIKKTTRATKEHKIKTVLLAGGVAANKKLRADLKKELQTELPKVELLLPDLDYCTDNAAMIAVAGYFHARKKEFTQISKIQADPNWELSS
ncbi:tRNA (adenosine(37)-N6)-threonylcarbamoyltransferase complex transferase subunit TsaD [Patescibacteria group bacterium]|nr:tRNA (adenosine(37)-N6)-threonylcarbamoyltransferase complex transferase subunit TsaD [Patescibacteria group bacterium]MBU1075347.1 tRNA (adenosine(37)-N6)-threonylcarbamoyltransferase complex transferase subunit TsaD [Patescibacteria group bacterium]MBU1951720.1 tRNA (adenosine(37)-N6)-threonylcarbamoyltransferase complex transferase subunit TsaD [Patescibacteria group bacterium]